MNNYDLLEQDISNGLNEMEFYYPGNFLRYQHGTQELFIRLDDSNNDQIRLLPNEIIEAPFSVLYITCEARGETIELLLSGYEGIKVYGEKFELISDLGFFDTLKRDCFIHNEQIATAPPAGLYNLITVENYSTDHYVLIQDIFNAHQTSTLIMTTSQNWYGVGARNTTIRNKYLRPGLLFNNSTVTGFWRGSQIGPSSVSCPYSFYIGYGGAVGSIVGMLPSSTYPGKKAMTSNQMKLRTPRYIVLVPNQKLYIWSCFSMSVSFEFQEYPFAVQ